MTTTETGVVLARKETGSQFLHRLLREAAQAFPELAGAQVPADASRFKREYGDALVRFEAARIASPNRVAIARHLLAATHGSLALRAGGRDEPLLDALRRTEPAPPTERHPAASFEGLEPAVPLDGKLYRGREVLEAIDRLREAHHLTHAAHAGLRWIVERAQAQGGRLDLRGERFALLGAGAELSPAPLLLAAGATVRWVDVKPPARAAGTVTRPGGDDLLTRPLEVAASLREFAAQGPVHLGLFAYAPGASRELRLAGVMDALVHALGAEVVKSVSLYVSPTSPGEMQPEDLAVMEHRRVNPKAWQRGFALARTLKGPGFSGTSAAPVARAIISLQGAAYQAAQYLTKLISAEVLAADGLDGRPVVLSANVAGITNTRSLSHPLFQVAFQGAPAFGVRIFEPDTTRALSGLLMLSDLLDPASQPAAGASELDRARHARRRQIHGGTYDLPWQFESAVRTAAVIGVGKRPDLLLRRAR